MTDLWSEFRSCDKRPNAKTYRVIGMLYYKLETFSNIKYERYPYSVEPQAWQCNIMAEISNGSLCWWRMCELDADGNANYSYIVVTENATSTSKAMQSSSIYINCMRLKGVSLSNTTVLNGQSVPIIDIWHTVSIQHCSGGSVVLLPSANAMITYWSLRLSLIHIWRCRRRG